MHGHLFDRYSTGKIGQARQRLRTRPTAAAKITQQNVSTRIPRAGILPPSKMPPSIPKSSELAGKKCWPDARWTAWTRTQARHADVTAATTQLQFRPEREAVQSSPSAMSTRIKRRASRLRLLSGRNIRLCQVRFWPVGAGLALQLCSGSLPQ